MLPVVPAAAATDGSETPPTRAPPWRRRGEGCHVCVAPREQRDLTTRRVVHQGVGPCGGGRRWPGRHVRLGRSGFVQPSVATFTSHGSTAQETSGLVPGGLEDRLEPSAGGGERRDLLGSGGIRGRSGHRDEHAHGRRADRLLGEPDDEGACHPEHRPRRVCTVHGSRPRPRAPQFQAVCDRPMLAAGTVRVTVVEAPASSGASSVVASTVEPRYWSGPALRHRSRELREMNPLRRRRTCTRGCATGEVVVLVSRAVTVRSSPGRRTVGWMPSPRSGRRRRRHGRRRAHPGGTRDVVRVRESRARRQEGRTDRDEDGEQAARATPPRGAGHVGPASTARAASASRRSFGYDSRVLSSAIAIPPRPPPRSPGPRRRSARRPPHPGGSGGRPCGPGGRRR